MKATFIILAGMIVLLIVGSLVSGGLVVIIPFTIIMGAILAFKFAWSTRCKKCKKQIIVP